MKALIFKALLFHYLFLEVLLIGLVVGSHLQGRVDFPVNATLNVSAIVNDAASQNLADILNSGVQTASILLKDSTSDANEAIQYTMKGN